MSLVFGLNTVLIHAVEGDPRGLRIKDITMLSDEQLAFMEYVRRNAGNPDQAVVSPEVMEYAQELRGVIEAEGMKPIADRILESYDKDDAWRELTAAGIAVLHSCGYSKRMSVMDQGFMRKIDKSLPEQSPEKLTERANALVDALLSRDHPHARDAAVEALLSIFYEGKATMHCRHDTGRRNLDELPEALATRAAEMLKSDDPFNRCMADWMINIKVCVDNDIMGWQGTRIKWQPDTDKEWFKAWQSVPQEEHLNLDYMRQAISLEMHRRGKDLLTLAADVKRRAEERAVWSRPQLAPEQAQALDAAIEQMNAAYQEMAQFIESNSKDLSGCRKQWLQWRRTVRPVVLNAPDVDFDQLVYLKRYAGGYHLQPGIHDPQYADGGDIYVQAGLEPTAPIQPLIGDKIRKGFAQDLDLWYDADRIVFSHTDEKRLQKLYEIKLDGSGLQKVTDGLYHDVDPAWLPDGGIVYGSMAAEAGIMCESSLGMVDPGGMCHTGIFRLNTERDEIRRLTYCKDDDCYPAVLNDGRVMWMRWDYQERGVDEIFSLWAIRPDGTGSDGFYRVHIPDSKIIESLRDARAVPGSNKLIVAAGGTHRSGQEGIIMLCDTSKGINSMEGFYTVTPQGSQISRGFGSELKTIAEGGVPYIGGCTQKPYALSEKSFLASFSYDMPASSNFQLYFMDVWGNKELIHRDKMMDCVAVQPVRKRPKPPVLPDLTDQSKTYATLYVEDVYRDLPGVEKGEVKYLRIAQQMFWLTRANTQGIQYHPLANASECFAYGTGGPVRVIGTVPVEEDGSIYFEAPAKVDLYFQALDKDHRAVQRMRTHVEFAPGENRGCVGCHETRGDTVSGVTMRQAISKQPVRPTPPPWGDSTLINYETMVQPVFDSKCVKCHGEKEPKGGLDLSSKKDQYGFMQSFRSMYGLKPGDGTPRVKWAHEGPVKAERAKSPDHPWWNIMWDYIIIRQSVNGQLSIPNIPKEYGAIRHPLATKLVEDEDHAKLLSEQEKELIMTWFDVQSPYFDTYMQQAGNGRGKKLVRVKVDPYPPFGESRDHVIHRPDEN